MSWRGASNKRRRKESEEGEEIKEADIICSKRFRK